MSTPSSTSYKLILFDPAHITETAELLYISKLGLTINRLLFKDWPNEAMQRKNYTSVIENLPGSEFEGITAVDEVSGEVLAHLAIRRKTPVANNDEEEKGKGGAAAAAPAAPEIPEFFNAEVFSAVRAAVSELSQGLEEVDHLELTYIVVKPAHRGRGIGKALMEFVFERAKALGIPIAVSAEPQLYEYFKKRAFTDRHHVDFELAKWAPPYSGFGTFRLAGLMWYP
ncbi:hypothetical protein BJY01DRAFT_254466 [Aspergillus pseudoustus]|uniref:N-acetyltransferase domain-containing protein n=1 Tax=Aspergillus pseudoustus TaxID=1810923 RepID=A0ABR4IVW5_9EURO